MPTDADKRTGWMVDAAPVKVAMEADPVAVPVEPEPEPEPDPEPSPEPDPEPDPLPLLSVVFPVLPDPEEQDLPRSEGI